MQSFEHTPPEARELLSRPIRDLGLRLEGSMLEKYVQQLYSELAAKGGQDSFYAIDYAARMAMEMGADVVKLNFPKLDPEKAKDSPAPYNELDVTPEEAVRQIVESAGRSLVVLSGGSKTDDETVLSHTRSIMEAGGSGVIFGRNVWQREWSEALEIIEQIKETLLTHVRRIP